MEVERVAPLVRLRRVLAFVALARLVQFVATNGVLGQLGEQVR